MFDFASMYAYSLEYNVDIILPKEDEHLYNFPNISKLNNIIYTKSKLIDTLLHKLIYITNPLKNNQFIIKIKNHG